MTDAEKIKFIEDAISHLFKKTMNIKPSDNLLELSLDSLEIVELQMYYEEVTGIEMDADSTVVKVSDMMALMK
jgi:acyl carrier protein